MMRHLLGVVVLFSITTTFLQAQITCDSPLTVTIQGSTSQDPLNVSCTPMQPTCNVSSGALDGGVDVTVTGGSTPFTFVWQMDGTDMSDVTEDLSNLGTGTYAVTVTDANNCTGECSVTLTEPTPVDVAGEPTNLDCNSGSGAPSGGINITPSGGQGTDEADYTYAWTTPDGSGLVPTDADQADLSAGTYTVVVTDVNGCTDSDSWTLTEPTPVDVIGTTTDLTCNASNGPANGIIDITPSGGQGTDEADYTYAWTTPDGSGLNPTGADQSGLSAGTYEVVVTDGNGCTDSASFTLNEPMIISILASTTDLDCHADSGPADGEIDISVTGGTPGYTYAWTTADGSGLVASDEDQTGLSAGTYDLVVTDANGCTQTDTYTLTQPDAVEVAGALTNLDCNSASGVPTGAIDITASGGQGSNPGDYTYNWMTTDGSGLVATDANQTGLSAGTYDVTVTDANGCTVTASYDLTEPTPVTVALAQDPINCSSLDPATGIMLTPGGGTEAGNYDYAWTGPAGETALNATSQNQTGLTTAGTYNVTVTDDNGCTATGTINVTVPDPITADLAFTQPTCNVLSTPAVDGTITISNELGGTAPYSYAWTGPGTDNADGANQTGLGTGSYSVTVSDALGCEFVLTQDLIEPTPVTVALAQDPIDCSSLDPATGIMLTPGGGTEAGDYEYAWTGPAGETALNATSQNQTGLTTAGTYNVTVTDDNGCTATETINVTVPDPITADLAFTQPTCNVLSTPAVDGTITISNELGGTAPYSYAWTGPGTDNADGANQTGLGAGSYTVVVSDALGCQVTLTQDLVEPTEVVVTGMQTDLDCNSGSGAPTGGITITPSGGQGTTQADYTYAWTTLDGSGLDATAADQSNLSAGTYTVVVTDANGCTDENTWTLTEPTAVDVTALTTDLDCNVSNGPPTGQIDVMPSGGQGTTDGDYTYAWTTDDGFGLNPTGGDQTDLGAGTYNVTVTDVNGCTAEGSWTLTEPIIISILANSTDLECNDASGAPDGAISITVSGGTPGYTYAWTTADGSGVVATDEDQSGLSAGTYDLVVTDANGCTQADSYTLTEPDAVVVEGTVTPLLCNALSGAPSGEINITATGGQGSSEGDYDYLWTTTDGSGLVATAADQTGLSAGTYTVVVTDANDCTDTETWTLGEPDAVECTLDSPVVGLGGTHILCAGDETGTLNVTATGGTAPYLYSLDGGATTQTSSTFVSLLAGVHTVTVIDANGCESECMYELLEPEPLNAGTCVVADLCQLNEGEIEVAAEGGVAPYVVTWISTTGGTLNETQLTITTDGGSVIFTGAEGGETYVFTVTDANGCEF